MKPILEIQHVSKTFRLHGNASPYLSLRDRLGQLIKPRSRYEEFKALDDVSFTVYPGDTLGIVGHNGAGKSTLLKILSRITPPTSGRIVGRGRIASLLEVGTGFHPELTGRENIFLNGSILGMKREEIRRKFDEIVDFSGVERFLDTPLKHYSSGMQLRLAFSVAAFLEPEILVVDEVLAVGDAEFQRKCLRKMESVSRNGRTILFVSHNMDALQSLCQQGLWLSGGKIKFAGSSAETVSRYLEHAVGNTAAKEARHRPDKGVWINRISIENTVSENTTHEIAADKPVIVKLHVRAEKEWLGRPQIVAGIGIDSSDGRRLLSCSSLWISRTFSLDTSEMVFACRIPQLPLIAGTYFVSAVISEGSHTFDFLEHGVAFRVAQQGHSYGLGREKIHGEIFTEYEFEQL